MNKTLLTECEDLMDFIKSKLSRRSMFEQLAEEAAELNQACLKYIRTMEGSDNPTPIGQIEAKNKVYEEFTDVMLVADLLRIVKMDDIYLSKLYRWKDRIEKNGKTDKYF